MENVESIEQLHSIWQNCCFFFFFFPNTLNNYFVFILSFYFNNTELVPYFLTYSLVQT